MLRTNKLLLDVDLFSTSVLSGLNFTADTAGKQLLDIMPTIEVAAKRIKSKVTTASGKCMIVHSCRNEDDLLDLVDVASENKVDVYINKKQSSFYAYGCPLLDFIKLVSIKLSMDSSSTKYQRDKIQSQIESMATLPVLVSLIPSEVIYISNDEFHVASASSITGLQSFYEGVNITGVSVEDGLFDSILLSSISDGFNVNREEGELLVKAIRNSPEDVDFTTLFFPTGVKWLSIDPLDFYSMDLTMNQRIELLKAKDIGLTLATMCHRIISSGDVYDKKSHLLKIGDYMEAYHQLLDFKPTSNWLGEQLDVNVGYTAANALVPISSQIASFASFVNSFEEVITFGHLLEVKSVVNDIDQLKWVNYFKQPINLVNEIIANNISVASDHDNRVTITSTDNSFAQISFTSSRLTTISAISEMVGRNEGFIAHYYKQLLGLIDLIFNVAAGGKVQIDLSQSSYSVKSSPYLIKRILYPWIYTKSAKIKKK